MLTVFLFLVGLGAVIKGAGLLVDGASAIARRLRVSDLVIGLTIVAFGTSAPELVVNLFASVRGETEIAIGNVVGSNIANILLILGVAAVIFPLRVTKGTVWKEIPLSLLAAVLLGVMVNDVLLDGMESSALTRTDGLALLAFFIIFLYYTFGIARQTEPAESDARKPTHGVGKATLFVLLGFVGLIVGGKFIVDGAVAFATGLGVSTSLIGLTIVAVGTSLPELATSAVAAYRKNADIAVGNVVGSNIFNIFFILGISSVIRPLPVQPASTQDILVAVAASAFLFAFMFLGKRHVLERSQGVLFLVLYAGYVTLLVIRG
ncbi:MAG: calcium/sodium antiporter [Candidatus Kerfeldbacteria bacterium]|nr:calcium/sodium antiporter [Candidatus Kerfeldbacteria bacterium]